MEDIKEKFVHDVSIRQVATIDTLETSIGLTQFADNPHRLQGCIIAHGSSDAKTICSAIGAATEYVNRNVLEHIKIGISD